MWRTIGAAYAFVFGRPLLMLRLGGIWLAIVVLADIWRFLPSALQPTWRYGSLAATLAVSVIAVLFIGLGLLSFCVALHRAVQMDEARSWFAALRFRWRESRFLGHALLILLLIAFPIVFVNYGFTSVGFVALKRGDITVATLFLSWYAIMIPLLLLVWAYGSRLMLVFPAVAADETGDTLSRAWERSRGNAWRIYLGSILCVLPFTASGWLVRQLLGPKVVVSSVYSVGGGMSYTVSRGGELHDAISSATSFLELCVLVAFYSYCYRQLAPTAEASGLPAPQAAPAE